MTRMRKKQEVRLGGGQPLTRQMSASLSRHGLTSSKRREESVGTRSPLSRMKDIVPGPSFTLAFHFNDTIGRNGTRRLNGSGEVSIIVLPSDNSDNCHSSFLSSHSRSYFEFLVEAKKRIRIEYR